MRYARKHVSKCQSPFPRLTPRALKWLDWINRHGPLPSSYLYELTRDTHHCKDTALRQMQTLCQQGVLFRPPQQQSALYAPFNPYVYDLTNRGHEVLFELGVVPNRARPTGHFPHLFLTACVTASIELTAMKGDAQYIAARTILDLRHVSLGLPLKSGTLIPDQIFAIRNADGYRVFALEVDRGTEPATSTKLRKSYVSSIHAYNEVLSDDLHRKHYGIKSNLIVLWVFATPGRRKVFLDLLAKTSGLVSARCFTTVVEGFQYGWRPPKTTIDVTAGAWSSCDDERISLS